VKYQFEMSFELYVSRKNIFWSTLAHQGWIGCASWLVPQKDNVGGHFFPLLLHVIVDQNVFFPEIYNAMSHFELIFHSVGSVENFFWF